MAHPPDTSPVLWTVRAGDALDCPADVLVCPANVFLTLSGGVGGEILLRHGDAMQKYLQAWLGLRKKKFVNRGDIIETPSCGTPFGTVLHAVAVDGLYQSSAEVVNTLVARCLNRAAVLRANSVTLTALATGYGHLPVEAFAKAIFPLTTKSFGSVQSVCICIRSVNDAKQIAATLFASTTAPTPR